MPPCLPQIRGAWLSVSRCVLCWVANSSRGHSTLVRQQSQVLFLCWFGNAKIAAAAAVADGAAAIGAAAAGAAPGITGLPRWQSCP